MNFIFRCLTVDPSQQLLQSKEMFALAFQPACKLKQTAIETRNIQYWDSIGTNQYFGVSPASLNGSDSSMPFQATKIFSFNQIPAYY